MKSYKDNQCIIIRFWIPYHLIDSSVENREQARLKLPSESCNTLPTSRAERPLKFKKSKIWFLLRIPYLRVSVVQRHCEITILLVMGNISRYNSTHRENQ